jgi:hypothetical protein
MPLAPPDTHHLSAAIGWLELGDSIEAGEELARISAAALEHPDVLEVRWQICAVTKSWEAAAEVAELCVARAPDRASGWLHRAFAKRRTPGGGLDAAWETLRPAFEKFPDEPIIPFNLACYAAQAGRLDEAWDWLQHAIRASGNLSEIRRMALADPDLQPLWERIRQL